jgi:hypothetical protein
MAKDKFSMLTWSLFEYGSAFGQLLDDLPLLKGEISSSVLTATAFLLLLIASDTPGLQVYVASNLFHILLSSASKM